MAVVSVLSQILVPVIVTRGDFFATVSVRMAFKTRLAPWTVTKYVPKAFGMMAYFADSVNMDAGLGMLGNLATQPSAPLVSSDAVTTTTATATVN